MDITTLRHFLNKKKGGKKKEEVYFRLKAQLQGLLYKEEVLWHRKSQLHSLKRVNKNSTFSMKVFLVGLRKKPFSSILSRDCLMEKRLEKQSFD